MEILSRSGRYCEQEAMRATETLSKLYSRLVAAKLQPPVCAVAAAWGWSVLLAVDFTLSDLVLVGLTTAAVYQWNRISDPEDRLNCPEEWNLSQNWRRAIMGFVFGAMTVVVVTAITVGSEGSLPLVGICLLLGAAYSGPFPRRGMRLKNLCVAKNISSAIGWTVLCVLGPALGELEGKSVACFVAMVYNFTILIIIELLWDVRDEVGDVANGITTVPSWIGYRRTIQLCHWLNGVATLVILTGWLSGVVGGLWLITFGNALFILVWLRMKEMVHRSRTLSHYFQACEMGFAVTAGLCGSLSGYLT